MSIVLVAIKFNHDPNAADSDAINVRKNLTEFIAVPEWQRGASFAPEDSRAAYAVGRSAGKVITIQARFRRLDPGAGPVEVRAVDPSNPRGAGCCYEILRRMHVIPIVPPPYGNCLGEVKARTVSFGPEGETAFETFELSPLWPLSSFKLGIHTVTWQWQYRLGPGAAWVDIDRTCHRIYTTADLPRPPWQQLPYDPSNTQLPWTDALEKACRWAAGAGTADEAAAMITRAVNRNPLQSYTPMTMFGFSQYFLSSYLGMLDGGTPFRLNCTDCADAVTTFANLLGCDLVEGRFFDMVTRKFLTLDGNPSVVGDWVSWTWNYHEICWQQNIDPGGPVYDGCLQLDRDTDDTDSVHIAQDPIRMPFGEYRNKLIESGSGALENVPRHRALG